MAYMAFNVKRVRDFLADHGHVVTVRGYDYSTRSATVPDLHNIPIKRVKVCEIKTESDLSGFVPLSGFKTSREWWKQIKTFCRGRMWLYRVRIDDEAISRQEREYENREHRREHQSSLIDDMPGFKVDRDQYRDEEDKTTMEEHNIYDPIRTHSLDVRSGAEMHDPTLVNLQPFKDAVHSDRIDADDRARERYHERMREMYDVHPASMASAPTQEPHDPAKIMRVSHNEELLKTLCGNR